MRAPLLLIVLLAATVSYGATSEIAFPFEKAFIPNGFDSNDNAQVVLAGTLPDTCYQTTRVEFTVDKARGVISATQWAVASTDICLPATVPFFTVLSLGNLDPGDYTVEDAQSGRDLGLLPVTLAKSPEPDDFPYAPLTNAYINEDPATGETELVLEGDWMDRCTQFKQVDVIVQADVVVVKPIVEHPAPADSRACGIGSRAGFEKHIALRNVPAHTYLLHVRSAKGRAINKLIYK